DPGAAVDPHHDRPAGAAGRPRPHVEGEAILALLVDQDAEHRGQRAGGLVGGRPEARAIALTGPRLRRLGCGESPRPDGWLRERDAPEHGYVALRGPPHPAPSRLDHRPFCLHGSPLSLVAPSIAIDVHDRPG